MGLHRTTYAGITSEFIAAAVRVSRENQPAFGNHSQLSFAETVKEEARRLRRATSGQFAGVIAVDSETGNRPVAYAYAYEHKPHGRRKPSVVQLGNVCVLQPFQGNNLSLLMALDVLREFDPTSKIHEPDASIQPLLSYGFEGSAGAFVRPGLPVGMISLVPTVQNVSNALLNLLEESHSFVTTTPTTPNPQPISAI